MGRRAPVVLMVYAHPDDETFGCGGTTALLAERGARVHILLATRGQAGQVGDPELDTPTVLRDLGAVREAESRAAAALLGATDIGFLDYVDGSLHLADQEQLADAIADRIIDLGPDVVVTFGPEGIYGHPDHIAVHAATVTAVDRAADARPRSSGKERHTVGRLFYQVVTREFADAVNASRGPVMLDGRAHPFVGYAAEEITTSMDVTRHREAKLEALACHRTQTAGRMDELRERLSATPLFEHFVLAQSRVPDHEELATDILAGLG